MINWPRLAREKTFEVSTGGDLDSTLVTKPKVHAERVVTLVNQSL
jgi:hypothetical protein